MEGCKDNPEEPSTTKIDERIPCLYSMNTILTFDQRENKNHIYRVLYYMK